MTNERLAWKYGLGIPSLVIPLLGCSSGFHQAVAQWTAGPSYSAPARALAGDIDLDETSKRIELMGYAGLACTVDEDNGKSKPDLPSAACKCAKPSNEVVALSDCMAWAQGL